MTVSYNTGVKCRAPLTRRGYGMTRRSPPRKVTYFEPVPPRLGRNIIIESTFDVGRRFRCTMRIDCGELNPGPSFGRYPANGTRTCPSISTKRSLPTDAADGGSVCRAPVVGCRLVESDNRAVHDGTIFRRAATEVFVDSTSFPEFNPTQGTLNSIDSIVTGAT